MNRNDKGSVLMLVVIFSFIMSVLGIAVLYLSGQELIASSAEIDRVRATNMADSGLEIGKMYIAGGCHIDHHCFPEHMSGSGPVVGTLNRGEIIVCQDRELEPNAYSAISTKKGQVTVRIQPNPSNDVDQWGTGVARTPYYGLVGSYKITSTGRVTSGVSGSIDTVKIESFILKMWWGTFTQPNLAGPGAVCKIAENSRREYPVTREAHLAH